MAKWPENTTIKFVSEYVNHDCLWNHENPSYKNKQIREIAYTLIKDRMDIRNFGVKEVITKVLFMRHTYNSNT